MGRNTTIIVASIILGGYGGEVRTAEGAPTPSSGPTISFVETVHDAGEVWEGARISHTFTFTNSGDEVLEIRRIRTTCGCTAGVVSENLISPGESGRIQGSFNTRGYRGRRTMPIFVHSNDPRTPVVRLRIEATVRTAATLSPRSLNFGTVRGGEATIRELELAFDGDPVPILEVSAHPSFIRTRIREEYNAATERVRLEAVIPPDAPAGRHRGAIIVRLDHPEVREIRANLNAVIEGPLSYSPPVIFFSEQEQKLGAAKIAVLINRDEQPVTIREVASGLPQFHAEARTLREGEEFEISVRPLPETKPARRAGEIVIKTDHPRQPSVRIPLRSAGTR